MVTPTGKVAPGKCDFAQTKFPEVVQLSVAVGSVQVTTAVQRPAPLVRVIFAGHPLITGFCVSLTVIVKLQVSLVLFAASFAV